MLPSGMYRRSRIFLLALTELTAGGEWNTFCTQFWSAQVLSDFKDSTYYSLQWLPNTTLFREAGTSHFHHFRSTTTLAPIYFPIAPTTWDIVFTPWTSIQWNKFDTLYIQFIKDKWPLHVSSITCSSSGGNTQAVLGILLACCQLAAPGLKCNINIGAANWYNTHILYQVPLVQLFLRMSE
jgi:hypothetical protein